MTSTETATAEITREADRSRAYDFGLRWWDSETGGAPEDGEHTLTEAVVGVSHQLGAVRKVLERIAEAVEYQVYGGAGPKASD